MSSRLIKAILGCVALLAVILIIPHGPRDKDFDNEEARQYFEQAQSIRTPREALKYFDMADKASPNTPIILHERGLAKCNLGMYNEGIKDIDRSIELSVDQDTKCIRYYNRGLVYMEMNDMYKACSDFKNAGAWGEDCVEKYCR